MDAQPGQRIQRGVGGRGRGAWRRGVRRGDVHLRLQRPRQGMLVPARTVFETQIDRGMPQLAQVLDIGLHVAAHGQDGRRNGLAQPRRQIQALGADGAHDTVAARALRGIGLQIELRGKR
ncbi:hypothetical protein D3C71_1828550 [compost metagenome]